MRLAFVSWILGLRLTCFSSLVSFSSWSSYLTCSLSLFLVSPSPFPTMFASCLWYYVTEACAHPSSNLSCAWHVSGVPRHAVRSRRSCSRQQSDSRCRTSTPNPEIGFSHVHCGMHRVSCCSHTVSLSHRVTLSHSHTVSLYLYHTVSLCNDSPRCFYALSVF